jgi:tRNA G18 (ribose-2'-O)-methylase SpoU
MRGYFGIGVEGISKAMNAGNLFRSAHAFGASFAFTVDAKFDLEVDLRKSDTSDSAGQVPYYSFESVETMLLPDHCALVGIELMDDAIDLPSFRHPRAAAYVLGMERGSLSPEMVACCDHIVKIPTRFCLNLATAGAVVMYDRRISLDRFADRPITAGGPDEPLPPPVFGAPVWKRKEARRARKLLEANSET